MIKEAEKRAEEKVAGEKKESAENPTKTEKLDDSETDKDNRPQKTTDKTDKKE